MPWAHPLVACAWFNGPLTTLVQRNVPEEKMGRALGLTTAGMGIASPVGIAIGIAPFFLVDGIACLAVGIFIYMFKSVRSLDKDQSSCVKEIPCPDHDDVRNAEPGIKPQAAQASQGE